MRSRFPPVYRRYRMANLRENQGLSCTDRVSSLGSSARTPTRFVRASSASGTDTIAPPRPGRTALQFGVDATRTAFLDTHLIVSGLLRVTAADAWSAAGLCSGGELASLTRRATSSGSRFVLIASIRIVRSRSSRPCTSVLANASRDPIIAVSLRHSSSIDGPCDRGFSPRRASTDVTGRSSLAMFAFLPWR